MRRLLCTAPLLLLTLAWLPVAPAHAGGLNDRHDANKTNNQCQQPVKDAAGRPVTDAMGHAVTTDCPRQDGASHSAVPSADRR